MQNTSPETRYSTVVSMERARQISEIYGCCQYDELPVMTSAEVAESLEGLALNIGRWPKAELPAHFRADLEDAIQETFQVERQKLGEEAALLTRDVEMALTREPQAMLRTEWGAIEFGRRIQAESWGGSYYVRLHVDDLVGRNRSPKQRFAVWLDMNAEGLAEDYRTHGCQVTTDPSEGNSILFRAQVRFALDSEQTHEINNLLALSGWFYDLFNSCTIDRIVARACERKTLLLR